MRLVQEWEALPRGSAERNAMLEREGIHRTQLANWRSRLAIAPTHCGCGANLPAAPSGRGRKRVRCDECQRAVEAQRHRLRRYGLEPEDFDRLVELQGGRCAACGARPATEGARTQRYLHVDHDHETGRVRGLLCHGCNLALGLVRESVDRLAGLIAYLERQEESSRECHPG